MRITAIALFMAMALSFLEARSQEPADTVAAYKNVTDVLVTRIGDTTRVTANVIGKDGEKLPFEYEVSVVENDTVGEIGLADDWGISLPFYTTVSKRDTDRVRRHVVAFDHCCFGWRFNYHGREHVKNCFELGLKQIVGIGWSKGNQNVARFSIGLGYSWQRYLAQDGFAYCKEGNKITVTPISAGQQVKSSRLDIFSFNIPVLYRQNIGRDFNFSVGGIMNLNTYAKAQTDIVEGNLQHKANYRGLQQNLFTADAFISAGTDGIGVYFLWSPMNVFKRCYGPELRAWSVGLDIFVY